MLLRPRVSPKAGRRTRVLPIGGTGLLSKSGAPAKTAVRFPRLLPRSPPILTRLPTLFRRLLLPPLTGCWALSSPTTPRLACRSTLNLPAWCCAPIAGSVRKPDMSRVARGFHALSTQIEASAHISYASMKRALTELVVAFPVYRCYGMPGSLPPADARILAMALERTVRELKPEDYAALDFIGLALRDPLDEKLRAAQAETAVRFQQLTAPIAANHPTLMSPVPWRTSSTAAARMPTAPIATAARADVAAPTHGTAATAAPSSHTASAIPATIISASTFRLPITR